MDGKVGKQLSPDDSTKQYSCSSTEGTNNTKDSLFVPLQLSVSPLVTTKKPRKPSSKRTKFTMLPSKYFLNDQQEPSNLIDVVVKNSDAVPAEKTEQEIRVVVIENSDEVPEKTGDQKGLPDVVVEKSDAVPEKTDQKEPDVLSIIPAVKEEETDSLISKPDNEAVVPKSSEKTSAAAHVASEKPPGFLPKCKKPTGMKRLTPVESAAIQMFLNSRMDSTPVWRNGDSSCTRDQLYPLLFGKMVDDDVMDVFIAIMMEKIKSSPDDFQKVAFVRPLLFSVFQAEVEDAIQEIMKSFVQDFDNADLCLCPIVKSAHWHLLVLDKQKRTYFHYSSLQSSYYDDDAKETRDFLDNYIQKNKNFSGTDKYPLIHMTDDCPQQKLTSLDCPTFVMRFIDQIVRGKPLSLELKDVSLWRLKYAAQIVLDGISRNGESSNQQVPVKVVEEGSKVEE